MSTATTVARGYKPEPFFLSTPGGNLCAIYHTPDPKLDQGLDLLHVHGFANELYDTRPILSYQARQLAAAGVGVLLLDLCGCGDSEGDFSDATWERWIDDLEAGVRWLQDRRGQAIGLWGTRMGGLLAMDYIRQSQHLFKECVLWQPIISGEQCLTQFLRLRVAFSAIAEKDGAQRVTTKDLRDAFGRGENVEVAGYEICPALARALDNVNLTNLWHPNAGKVSWVEVVSPGGQIGVASQQVIEKWKQLGAEVDVHTPTIKPFWTYSRALASEYPELVALMRNIHGVGEEQ